MKSLFVLIALVTSTPALAAFDFYVESQRFLSPGEPLEPLEDLLREDLHWIAKGSCKEPRPLTRIADYQIRHTPLDGGFLVHVESYYLCGD